MEGGLQTDHAARIEETSSQFSGRNAALSSPTKPIEQWVPLRHRTTCAYRTCCNLRFCSGFALLICLTFLIGGAVLPEAFRTLVKDDIQSSLVLQQSNTAGLKGFISDADSEDRVYAKFYVQSIANPLEVLKGARPEIKEVGPFVYRMRNERFNLTWTEEGDILSFKQWAFFMFAPELSIGLDSETVVVSVNMLFHALAYNVVRYVPRPLRGTVLALLYPASDYDRLFIEKSVKETLFGYYDHHVSIAQVKEEYMQLFPKESIQVSTSKGMFFKGLVGNMTTRAQAAKATPTISLHTGKYIKDMMQHFDAFDHEDHLSICPLVCPPMRVEPLWGSPEANRIFGSDGSWFDTKLIEKRQNVYFFFPIFQRAINLSVISPSARTDTGVEDSKSRGRSKLDTVSYGFDPSFFENATVYPPNAAFYQFGQTGLFNASRIAHNLPMFFSQPHFLDGDEQLLQGVQGMSPPDPRLHGTLVQLHRFTGILAKLRLRFQINLNLRPIRLGKHSAVLANLRDVYLPLCWMEVNENLANSHEHLFELLDLAKTVLFYMRAAAWVICPVALLVSCWGSELIKQRTNSKVMRRRQSSLYEELLRESGEESSFYMQKYVNTTDVWRHSYFQWRLIWCGLVTLCVNLTAETIITSGAGRVPAWIPDPIIHESCALSLALTAFLVGAVTSYVSYHQASSGIALGDFPSVYWSELMVHIMVGLASLIAFSALPCGLMLVLNESSYSWYAFAIAKSAWAMLESQSHNIEQQKATNVSHSCLQLTDVESPFVMAGLITNGTCSHSTRQRTITLILVQLTVAAMLAP